MVAMAVAMACPETGDRTRSMQPAVRCPALPQFGSQSELECFIKRILQRLPCLARDFAKQQRCVLIDTNREVGYIGFIRFASSAQSSPRVHSSRFGKRPIMRGTVACRCSA